MSTILNTHTSCPEFQGMLVNYFATCPGARRPESPLFNFLYSDINRSNLRDVVNPIPGRKRVVTLVYDQPVSTSQVLAIPSCDRICDATTERGDTSKEYSIECTDGLYVEERIRLSDWNDSCITDGELINRVIKNMIDGLMARMYQKIAEAMPPLLGGWGSDINCTWIDADGFLQVSTASGAGLVNLNPAAFARLQQAKMVAGYCGPTFITGGIDLYGYLELMKAGCCTQNGINALDILNQQGEAVTYDRYVQAVMGADTSIMLQTGSIQMLTYNAVSPRLTSLGGLGELDMTYRNFFEAIIQDPLTGFPLDLTIKNDCGVVHIVLSATAKPVDLPLDLMPAGHPMEGITYAAGIQVVNA